MDIKKIAYEKYKLDWLMSHGYTLTDLINELDVVKEDEEVKILSKLTNEAIGGIKGKGFMYSLPISYLEGLDD